MSTTIPPVARGLAGRRRAARLRLETLAHLALPVADIAVLALGMSFSAFLLEVFYSHARDLWPPQDTYLSAIGLTLFLVPMVFYRFGLYDAHRGEYLAVETMRVIGALVASVTVLAVIAVLTKANPQLSRVWMLVSALICGLGVVANRGILRLAVARLRKRGWDVCDVILVGNGSMAARVLHDLAAHPFSGYRVVGYCSDGRVAKPEFLSIPRLGDYSSLPGLALCSAAAHTQIWVALSINQMADIRKILDSIIEGPAEVRLVPDVTEFAIDSFSVTQISGMPLVRLNASQLEGLNHWIKLAEDWLIASFAILLFAPVMAVIVVGIRMSSAGPIIFRQKRHGWHGEEIYVYKFRTMVMHEDVGSELGFTQAQQDDARVTLFGAFLRRTSLDELPQFFNVLKGEMSVVGPRPHITSMNDAYRKLIRGYMLRHKVKPGITGWAQVNGLRGGTDTLEKMIKRVEHDMYYIRHWSVWLDIAIVLMTFWRGFLSPRAY